jgi:uncharacterized protein (TIGR00369 family)
MTMTESTGHGRRLPVLEGGPESLFRVARPVVEGNVVRCSMPEGSWLNGADGRPQAGALGVLIDNALGCAIMLDRPAGWWSVSAEISLDLCGPPLDGARMLSVETRKDHSDKTGGIASGSVTDGSGRLVALCRQHGRWVPTAPSSPPAGTLTATPSWPPGGPADLAELLGAPAVAADGNVHLKLAVTGSLVNPLGNLHGGVTLYVCDLVAQAAARTAGGPWRTSSVHVAYPRPVPVGAMVRFEGRVLHRGRAFAVIQVTAANGSGKPCVIATVTAGVPA